VVGAFGRNEAPVISLPTLSAETSIILCTGIIPNRKGHPLIQRWMGISFESGVFSETLTLEEVLERTEFHQRRWPNSGEAKNLSDLQVLIPTAVDKAREAMHAAKCEIDERHAPELEKQLERLKAFKEERDRQLEMSSLLEGVRSAEKRKVQDLHAQYSAWIRDTLETEDKASIVVNGIFVGE
jgi:DNA-binding response OmpR family regulator